MTRRRTERICLVAALAAAALLAGLAAGCGADRLDVTVSVRNVGQAPVSGLSVVQRDGIRRPMPTVLSGETISVRVRSDEPFDESSLDLVDEEAGVIYPLPPYYFENSLHGTIAVELSRIQEEGPVHGRAKCDTDAYSDPKGWEHLIR